MKLKLPFLFGLYEYFSYICSENQTLYVMANKKSTKKEVTKKSQPKAEASNREESKVINPEVSMEDYEKSELNAKAVDAVVESLAKEAEAQEEITKVEEQPVQEEPKKKLKVLAADRLNQLIDEANELGITDVVQILNSDKYGQLYLVYRA
jgi:hypothetical protein